MIRKANEMETEVRHEMRGGKGDVQFLHAFKKEEFGALCRVCSVLTLEPGCSIGDHAHVGEDEIYYILTGTGKVFDHGEWVTVTAGDAVLTGKGASHSIENIGDDTLRLLAVVMTYPNN